MSPRPFALHLTLAAAALMSSKAGLPISNGVWPNSRSDPDSSPGTSGKSGPIPSPLWRGLPRGLAEELARFDPPAISAALDRAVIQAAGAYADGIEAYRVHPYRRPAEDECVVRRWGSTALLRHGALGHGALGHGATEDGATEDGAPKSPALFVPSLLNRGWVLDLIPGRGMLSWLADHGVDPYRIEWGAPGAVERAFDIGDYVRRRLEPALDEVLRLTGRPPVLVGYCMGGLLALASALRRPASVAALALLATPWDFQIEGADRSAALAALYGAARPFLHALGELPIDMIQALFTTQDPIVALRKFRRFADMDPESPEAMAFVALEDWLNDGVALSLPAADEALLGWYGRNTTGRGVWRIDGAVVDPSTLATPSLVVVPSGDRIVPPASAASLADVLPACDRLDVPLGHIGMVVGRRARDALWRPLAEWIAAR
jgi:polyhydroxyalkanoate synthase